MGEITEECRKLHNEEFKALYSSPSIVQVIKWGRRRCVGHGVAHKGGKRRGVYRVLVGKPETKRPLRSPRHKW